MTNSSTKDGGGVQRGRHNTTLLAWIFFFNLKIFLQVEQMHLYVSHPLL